MLHAEARELRRWLREAKAFIGFALERESLHLCLALRFDRQFLDSCCLADLSYDITCHRTDHRFFDRC